MDLYIIILGVVLAYFLKNKFSKLRKMLFYLTLDLEVDGGVNYETGKKCIAAGANILVAGSFLFNQENLTQASNQLYDSFNL